MSNILSSVERARVARIARDRLILCSSLMMSLVAFVALLAITPSLLTVAIPLMTSQGAVSSAEAESAALQEEGRSQASRTRSMVAVLAPFAEERASVNARITQLYALRPSGVSIETITYQSGVQGQISITGVSDAREPVNDFRTILMAEGGYESVSVPIAALVGALEGRFTMTLSGTF